MKKYIALFRGINVGGRNIIRMAELRELMADLGCAEVKSYIQSGNLVFSRNDGDRAALSEQIQTRVENRFGFRPQVLLLRESELQAALAANPFPAATTEPKSLHLFFLAREPSDPDLDALRAIQKVSERFDLRPGVFYLHAPEGIGRSKLAAKVEKALGVAVTARNWRTVAKIKELLDNDPIATQE